MLEMPMTCPPKGAAGAGAAPKKHRKISGMSCIGTAFRYNFAQRPSGPAAQRRDARPAPGRGAKSGSRGIGRPATG